MTAIKSGLSNVFPQTAPGIGRVRRTHEEWKAKGKAPVSKNYSHEDHKNKKEEEEEEAKKTKPAEPKDPRPRKEIVPPARHKGTRGGGEGVAVKLPTDSGHSGKRSKSKSLQVSAGDRSSGKGKLVAGKAMTTPDRQLKSEALVIRKSRSTNCLKSLPEHLELLRNLDDADPVDVGKLHAAMKSEYKTGKQFDAFFRQNGTSSDHVTAPSTGGSWECLLEGPSSMGIQVREKWRVERTGSGTAQIRSIRGMCFTETGYLAIAEPENARVQVLSVADGKPTRVLTDDSKGGRRMHPSGLCSVPGRSILVAADLNRFVFLDPGFRGAGWSSGVPVSGKTDLTGLACTARGDIVLTDTGVRPSVGMYETDGKMIREFKTVDWRKPSAVTVSCELGITFVSDSDAGCVFMFDRDGKLLNRLGRSGSDASARLVYPHGLCCLSRGTLLLVADRANLGVVVYDLRNRAVDHLVGVQEGPYSPVCLASWGDRYLAISNEVHDLKVDDYKLRLFRTKV